MSKKKPEPNQYDSMPIQDLKEMVTATRMKSREYLKEMYTILEYLRTTNRYKEDKMYAKSSFWVFIETEWNIREGTYRENVKVFTKYPDQAMKYGVGLPAKIVKQCGAMKAKEVFTKLEQEEKRIGRMPQRAKIDAIIEQNRDKGKIKHTYTDWQAMYEVEKANHAETKAMLSEANWKVIGLQDQIDKMKPIIEKYLKIKESLSSVFPLAINNQIAAMS